MAELSDPGIAPEMVRRISRDFRARYAEAMADMQEELRQERMRIDAEKASIRAAMVQEIAKQNKAARKDHSEWRAVVMERVGIFAKVPRDEMRRRVFERYGNACACCGEACVGFLTIDHVGGGGTAHRKKIGTLYYQDIFTSPNPETYRLLCMNCNWATRGGRTCPHKVA